MNAKKIFSFILIVLFIYGYVIAEDNSIREDNVKDGGLCLNSVQDDNGKEIGYEIKVWKGLFKGIMGGEIDVLYFQDKTEALNEYNKLIEDEIKVYGTLENGNANFLLLCVEQYGDLIQKQTVEGVRIGLYKTKNWK